MAKKVFLIKDSEFFTKGEDSKSYGRLVYSKKEARKELGNHSGRFIVRYKVKGSVFSNPKIIK